MNSEHKFVLSTTDFNDIVRRKIYQYSLEKKNPIAVEEFKNQSCQRAKKSREKRKSVTDDSEKIPKKLKSKKI